MAKQKKGSKRKGPVEPPSTAGKRSLFTRKGLILGAFYLIGLFLLQEVALRICFPLPELSNFNRINYQILEPTPGGPGYLRNRDMIWRSYPDTIADFVHDLNLYGYRDKHWKLDKSKGKKRIFFVGDSFVEGMMAPGNQTIPDGFRAAAGRDAADYELFNCGMMGIGLNEYVKFIAAAVPLFRPEEVFLVLYSNDIPFQKTYQPAASPEPEYFNVWRPRILELIDFIQAGDPIPFRWTNEQIPFHKPVPDPGNPWTVKEAEWSPHVRADLKDAMQKGQFNFFRLNWILEEEKFLRQAADISVQLNFLKNFLAKHQTKLSVFYIPSRSQVSNYYYAFEKASCLQNCPEQLDLTTPAYQLHRQILKNECAKRGFPFYDLTARVKQEEDRGNHLYWDYDDHMRGKGYMLLGESIWEQCTKE